MHYGSEDSAGARARKKYRRAKNERDPARKARLIKQADRLVRQTRE
jgi:hypothetical protein